MTQKITVRDATTADLPAILTIHNAAVAETTAIWDVDPEDLYDRVTWHQEQVRDGYPVLVADLDGVVAGYASYGPWRAKPGYRHTMENSVYVGEEFHHRGVATALMTELLERARKAKVHAMIAGVESSNTASLALHRKLGFEVVGTLPEVGWKFDRWLDLTLLQLTFPGPHRVASLRHAVGK
jgi:phosphinothricin acetyltransferase